MPFTVARLTAFWTIQSQMGLTACTRVQMAVEGLTTPDDFEDFPEKDDLEGPSKQLLKPPKTPGLGANALLQEIATFDIPAKSMIRLHRVRIIVLYYKMMGLTIEPGDLSGLLPRTSLSSGRHCCRRRMPMLFNRQS